MNGQASKPFKQRKSFCKYYDSHISWEKAQKVDKRRMARQMRNCRHSFFHLALVLLLSTSFSDVFSFYGKIQLQGKEIRNQSFGSIPTKSR